MKDQVQKFYLVRHDVLPEAMRKTIEAKQLIENGTAETIHDAVQKVDLSRSAYYKYKEAVYPFKTIVTEQIITLFFYIVDRTGTLSKLLKTVAESGCNILTIHQTIPIQGKANVTLSLDISALNKEVGTLIQTLKQLEFVERVDMLGSGT